MMGFPFFLAALSGLIFVLLAKLSGTYFKLQDIPDGELKPHQKAVPLTGGIGIALAFYAAILILAVDSLFLNSLYALGLFVIIGLWDDLRTLKPAFRLLAEILFSGLVIWLLGIKYDYGLIILFIFYMIGAINAVNMQDGIDGLAAGLVMISALAIALLGWLSGLNTIAVYSLALAGALFGFLVFNFNPASIFMGDNGAYFIGAAVSLLSILIIRMNLCWQVFAGMVLILGVPVFDTLFAIIRRLYLKKSPFEGDRSHFYDLLMQKGYTVKQTVILIYMIQIALASFGLLLVLSEIQNKGI